MTSRSPSGPAGSGSSPGDATASPGGDAHILAGGPIAEAIRAEAAELLAACAPPGGPPPGIVVVLVGDDAPSRVYARRILRNASAIGAAGRLAELPHESTAAQLRAELEALDADSSVAGVIVQMPLPTHIRPREVIAVLDPLKDVDGIHPFNVGLAALGYESFVPSCAEAAVEILKRTGHEIAGRRAVVVGRSSVVGRPAALLLLREHATVTVCHRRTRDLAGELGRADIVIAAAGAPNLIRGEMLRPGCTVIDCGINVVGGAIVGDVHMASAAPIVSAITPVPGGVGPVTNAVLMHHLARAVRAQRTGGFGDALPVSPTPPVTPSEPAARPVATASP